MVALSASRLVCPAMAWIRPDDLADAGGGVAELRHGATVRRASSTARRGDFGRAVGLAGDLADRGGQFLDRARRGGDVAGGDADALLGGARLGGHRVGGAVELGRRCAPAARRRSRTLASAWSTDISKRVMVAAMTSPRFSRSRLVSASLAASRSRSIMVSRNTMTVRAMAPSSSLACVAGMRAEVSPAASRVIALGQAVQRPRDAAPDQPAESPARSAPPRSQPRR